MKRDVFIKDVGPRDGLQSLGKALTVENRVALINALVKAGAPAIEAGSFVSPVAVPEMAATNLVFEALAGITSTQLHALIPNRRGYDLAKAAGARFVTLVVAATETMNRKNVNAGVSDSVTAARGVVRSALAEGLVPSACVAVAWECPFEGKTDPASVKSLVDAFIEMGAAEVVIADTIGAANPGAVYDLLSSLIAAHGAERIACHFHDTRAMGLANAYAAMKAGVRKFESSVGGLGGCPFAPGATGNVASEDLVMMLEQMGFYTGIDLAALMEAGRLAGELTGLATGGRGAQWRHLQLKRGAPLI